MNEFTSMAQKRRFEALKNELQTDKEFCLTAPEGENQDEDSLGELSTNDGIELYIDDSRDAWEELESDDGHRELYEDDDGQPTEYEEWQDVYGGDDWDHGQYDEC
tara:strand:- start:186 stop:500 length:315 start_codon:yes stop_codon:yes gene_type:complete